MDKQEATPETYEHDPSLSLSLTTRPKDLPLVAL